MPNKYNSCYLNLTATDIADIVKFYLEPNGKVTTMKRFGITVYALNKILSNAGCLRARYGEERNSLVSAGLKLIVVRQTDVDKRGRLTGDLLVQFMNNLGFVA